MSSHKTKLIWRLMNPSQSELTFQKSWRQLPTSTWHCRDLQESVEGRGTNDDFLQPLFNGLGVDVRCIFQDRAARSSFPCRYYMSRSVRQAHKSCSVKWSGMAWGLVVSFKGTRKQSGQTWPMEEAPIPSYSIYSWTMRPYLAGTLH